MTRRMTLLLILALTLVGSAPSGTLSEGVATDSGPAQGVPAATSAYYESVSRSEGEAGKAPAASGASVLAREVVASHSPSGVPTLGGLTIQRWKEKHDNKARALASVKDERRRLRRQVTRRWTPTLMQGIDLAAIAYGQSASALRRVSFCESRWFLYARSSGGHLGPFQFAPSTWASTPYGRFSVFDPIAAPLGAAWMWKQGRRGEWACR